jgi:hypothetical protein
MCHGRHNILLEGSDEWTSAVLLRLTPYFCDPVVWRAGAPFPIGSATSRTIVVPGVDALSRTEQSRLLRCVSESAGSAQVVSTTTEELYPLVMRGEFDATLYYRLNVVLLRVNTESLDPPLVVTVPRDRAESWPRMSLDVAPALP